MHVKAHRLEELELLFTLLSLLLAFLQPRLGRKFRRISLRGLRRFAKLPRFSILVVAALPLVLRLALLPWIPVPQPQIQEEFSNLLGADTFFHGRLANPQHPMAVFFDNVQEIQTPHYASARPPGDAFFLWIGEALFHLPWLGVCLSVSMMCAAFYWMLRAWTKPHWALLASILFALRFGVFSYWMNSYWGGSVSAFGAALILGAFPRLTNGPNAAKMLDGRQLGNASLFAFGCCLLASTRPYEGFLYCLPFAIAIAVWFIHSSDKLAARRRFTGTLLPIVALLAVFAAWLGFYNFSQTNNPFLTAYQLWRNQQGIVPALWWQPLRKTLPVYYGLQTEQFYTAWEVAIYQAQHASIYAGIVTMSWHLVSFVNLYLRPLLLLPFLIGALNAKTREESRTNGPTAGQKVLPDRRWDWLWLSSLPLALLFGSSPKPSIFFLLWILVWILCWHSGRNLSPRKWWIIPAILTLGAAGSMLTNFSMPTYYALYTAPTFVLVAAGMRILAAWRRPEGIGRAIVANLSLSCCLMFLIYAGLSVFHVHVVHESPFNWSSYENRLMDRVKVEKFLDQQPGGQLAIVRYGSRHDPLLEWVWNGAEIDRQKIVWARELKPEWTAQLVRYYSGRTIWLVEPDSSILCPYPAANLPIAGETLPRLTYRK